MLALQGIEDPVERRKRSVQRGKGALDVLDDLKIGLLSGNLDASTVSRLRDAAANLKSCSGDPGLDTVLSEIELRVEVELAKAGAVLSPISPMARGIHLAHRFLARNPCGAPFSPPLPILSVTWPRYIRRARTDRFRPPCT